jgi:hypothetical protein
MKSVRPQLPVLLLLVLVAVLGLTAATVPTQRWVNTGISPNDGTGDSLRTTQIKANQNLSNVIAYLDRVGTNGITELTNLQDVVIGSLTDGQVITWNAGLGRWTNAVGATGGGATNGIPKLNGSGTNTTLVNPAFSGGDWTAVTNGFLPQYFYRGGAPIPWVCIEEFDTDADDYGHLAVLLSLEKAGLIRLIYVGTTSAHTNAAFAAKAVLNSYGRSSVPVGQSTNRVAFGYQSFVQDYIVTNYVSAIRPSITNTSPLNFATGLRAALSAEADNSVVISIGSPCGLMMEMMATGPDGYSSLDGYGLLTNKLRRTLPGLMLLAGYYPNADSGAYGGADYNIAQWRVASSAFINGFTNFPVWFVESGTTTPMTMQSFRDPLSEMNPVSMAFQKVLAEDVGNRELYLGRECWGQTTALYPLFGTAMGVNTSVLGSNYSDSVTGVNTWTTNASGFHKYVWWNTNVAAFRKQAAVVSYWEAYGKPEGKGLPKGAMWESDYAPHFGRRHNGAGFRTYFEQALDFTYPADANYTNAIYGVVPGAVGAIVGLNAPGYPYNASIVSTVATNWLVARYQGGGFVISGPDGLGDLFLSTRLTLDKTIPFDFSYQGTNYATLNWNANNAMFTDQPSNTFSLRYKAGFAIGGTGFADLVLSNRFGLLRGIPMDFYGIDTNAGTIGANANNGLAVNTGTNSIVIRPYKELMVTTASGNPALSVSNKVSIIGVPLSFSGGSATNEQALFGLGSDYGLNVGTNHLVLRLSGTNGFHMAGISSGATFFDTTSNGITKMVLATGIPTNGTVVSFLAKQSDGQLVETAAPAGSGGGGATNGILMLNGFGTNTTIVNAKILGGTVDNFSLTTAGYLDGPGATGMPLYSRATNGSHAGSFGSFGWGASVIVNAGVGDWGLRSDTNYFLLSIRTNGNFNYKFDETGLTLPNGTKVVSAGVTSVTMTQTNGQSSAGITGTALTILNQTPYQPTVMALASTNIVFSSTNALFTYTLTGNTVFTASGYAAGAQVSLFITGDAAATRTVSFPGWTWLEGNPVSIVSNKVYRIDITSLSTTATNAAASYGGQL